MKKIENQMNESREDYLEAILVVTQQKGYCRSIDVANELGYSKASVSIALSKLRDTNLVNVDEKGRLSLTEEGNKVAHHTYEKHRFLKDSLLEIGVSEEQAEYEACRIEHIISDDTFEKMKKHFSDK